MLDVMWHHAAVGTDNRLLWVSFVVIEWQTFSGSRHLAKYVQLVDTGYLETASGNSQSLMLSMHI